MNTINTTLTTSGNSVAVRLPKALLKMSGLGTRVTLEAQHGKIIISMPDQVRAGWDDQIQALIAENGDPTQEFADLHSAPLDGLQDLAWDGPTFEEWQKKHGKIS